jgi:predicted nucleic acid-binding protein
VISLDTNILVRLIVNDDAQQVARARTLILERGGSVQSTVLIETAWVLGKTYGFNASEIASFLLAFSETQQIRFELGERLPSAMAALAKGVDAADAIHVAGCQTEAFATFDTALTRRAPEHFKTPAVITP